MSRLQISDSRERRLVSAADHAMSVAAAVAAPFRRRQRPSSARRILLLRLERIGDLLMTLPAIADVRALAPDAEIDLIVGSWNGALANAIAAVSRVEALDASWLSRAGPGRGLMLSLRHARQWRMRHSDLAINFEPDIRSNLLLAMSGATWIVGYRSGGGGPVLDQVLDFDTRSHTADNAQRLVGAAFESEAGKPETGGGQPVTDSHSPGPASRSSGAARLNLPESATRAVIARLSSAGSGPLIAIHTSGGRAIKQWDPARFAEVARRLATEYGATVVLTGEPADRPLVDTVKRVVPQRQIVDVSGDLDLLQLAALLERVDLLITGDTGPLHLAQAVGTAVVAIFGPSDPARYGPRGPADRVVRVDLPCSPCNRIRQPPARCVGHTPDCLFSVSIEQVVHAASSVLAGTERRVRAQV
jgi:ADP-heptose:LPS heptosyltransferase